MDDNEELDDNEEPKKKLSVVIFIILTCLIYTGLTALIANNIFQSIFYDISNNTEKLLFYIVMFVIFLPIVATVLCKFYIKQTDTIIKLCPNYQYIFTYISIFPAIILTYVIGMFFIGNISVRLPNFVFWIIFVMLISLPYTLLNIIYRTLFIKGSFKNIDWGFLTWIFHLLLG